MACKMSLGSEPIPDELLVKQLTPGELTAASSHLVEWPEKARLLGFTSAEIENITKDNEFSLEQQKEVMMRKWGKKYGEMATLGGLLEIAERNGWIEFYQDVCSEWGFEVEIVKN